MNKFWKRVDINTPHCYLTGDWDGKKSDDLFILDDKLEVHVGTCYSVNSGDTTFIDFIDKNGYEIYNVIKFAEIPDIWT